MFHKRLLFVASLATTLITAAVAQAPGRWSNGTPMPSSRTEVAVAELGGKIYVVGGFSGERDLEIYDPTADRWSRRAAFPHEVHHAAAVGLNGKLYVVGGYVQGWTPSDAVYEYDPASDRWRTLAPMPTARGALGAAVLAGKIHAVSGVGAGGKNTPAHEMYDPTTHFVVSTSTTPDAARSPGRSGPRWTAVRDCWPYRRQLFAQFGRE
jgi:N-acetylneuraminic acid mutarotase